MANYSKHLSKKTTPQSSPIPGEQQVKNNAGGYVYNITPWKQLERFLILGTEGGTYYVNERALTLDNAKAVVQCIKEDGKRAVDIIRSTSLTGKAPKNDPAIFALALACTVGNEETKKAAYNSIKDICRIGTHLFQFCQSVQDLRGWSRGLRNGVAQFYIRNKDSEQNDNKLALQLTKYQQRNGWTHKDVLRLCHAKPITPTQKNLLQYTAGKYTGNLHDLGPLVEGMHNLKGLNPNNKEDLQKAIKLILENNLTREMVPSEFYNKAEIWDALLQNMPMTALIRNLGKMTSVGLLKSNLDNATKLVVKKLSNGEALKKARIHPLNALIANRTYKNGHGDKGSLSWSPVSVITSTLEDVFYNTFEHVEPTNKNTLLGLDVSGSMTSPMNNLPISFMDAALCMLMVAVRTEPFTEAIGFDTVTRKIPITAKDTLDVATKKAYNRSFGGTDCAQPMLWAKKNKLPVDAFYVYTDNETWAGGIHPSQALVDYRKSSGRDAKLAVVGMAATAFSIADPKDPGMLDVVGFGTDTPAAIAQFIAG